MERDHRRTVDAFVSIRHTKSQAEDALAEVPIYVLDELYKLIDEHLVSVERLVGLKAIDAGRPRYDQMVGTSVGAIDVFAVSAAGAGCSSFAAYQDHLRRDVSIVCVAA